MFNLLFSLFKDECALRNVNYISIHISIILEYLDKENLKVPSFRDEAIDAVIKILNQCKDIKEN